MKGANSRRKERVEEVGNDVDKGRREENDTEWSGKQPGKKRLHCELARGINSALPKYGGIYKP